MHIFTSTAVFNSLFDSFEADVIIKQHIRLLFDHLGDQHTAEPGVVEHLADTDARLLALVEHPIDQVLRLVGDVAPQFIVGEVKLLLHYIPRGVSLVMCEERQSEGQHHVHHYSERPHVCLISVGMVENDLGGAVREGAEGVRAFLVREQDKGQAEIYDLGHCPPL